MNVCVLTLEDMVRVNKNVPMQRVLSIGSGRCTFLQILSWFPVLQSWVLSLKSSTNLFVSCNPAVMKLDCLYAHPHSLRVV